MCDNKIIDAINLILHSLKLGNLIKCLKLCRKKIKTFRIASWYHNDTFVIYHWESTVHIDAVCQHQVRWKVQNSFYVLEMILGIQITDWIHLIHFDQFQYFENSFKTTKGHIFCTKIKILNLTWYISETETSVCFSRLKG